MKVRLKIENQMFHYAIITLVILIGLYGILPILILRDKYIFPIHDNLDHIAGMVEYIHDNHLFFRINDKFPVLGGIPGYYIISYISYGISGILGYIFGYLYSQVIIRIIGVILGFISLYFLLVQIFRTSSKIQNDFFKLLSIIYAVTPTSLTRILSFAILPLIIGFFIYLNRKNDFSKISFLSILFPFFSYFNAVTLFAIIFWFLASAVVCVKQRKRKSNIIVAFVGYVVGTIISDIAIIKVVLHGNETNRSLHYPSSTITSDKILENALYGQYHAFSYYYFIISFVVVLGLLYCIFRCFIDKNHRKKFLKYIYIFFSGIFIWMTAALLETLNSNQVKTGIQILDGFQWGRIIGWGRLLWIVMLALVIVVVTGDEQETKYLVKITGFRKLILSILAGILLATTSVVVLNAIFKQFGFPNKWNSFLNEDGKNVLNTIRWICLFFFSVSIVGGYKKTVILSSLCVVLVQGCFVLTVNDRYTDNTRSVVYAISGVRNDESINFKEFFSSELFEEIKQDISYNGEGVAAYGFHPSVLMYNGFNTIDGYLSVHPMMIHEEFRRIIAPALEKSKSWKDYYDNWGGRMYLYGDLSYGPSRNKNVKATNLYINVEAFKAMGGKYILSRGEIGNFKELGLTLDNDYNFEESLYHIYLYTC